MSDVLCITVRFLQPYSHARGEDGSPEWPPAPLRLFQALVASAIGRAVNADSLARAEAALRWLELQPPPEIVAPATRVLAGHLLFVPDNVGDKVAKAWSAGREAAVAEYRTEKPVWPREILGEAVHYVFRGATDLEPHFTALRVAARSITHLGWGIDMVAADATHRIGEFDGERWIPGKTGSVSLRCAIGGTLDALERRHEQFLQRVDGGLFRPVPPVAAFMVHPYARATDVVPRPVAAFRLLHPRNGRRVSLDPPRRARDVAAWTRHAVAAVCAEWPFGPTAAVVHGHTEGGGAPSTRDRLSFLPLPTITPRGAEGIARVLIVGTPALADEVAWVRTRLAGHELVWKRAPVALLEPLHPGDWVMSRYLGESTWWSTVTPVVLPGHDGGSPRKAERLLRKAFLQAGFPAEIVEGIRELEWRNVAFTQGVDRATHYLPPDKINGPRFHVRVRFHSPQVGPFAIGSGRHRGLGIFAVAVE